MKIEWDFHEFFEFADKLSDFNRLEEKLQSTSKELGEILLKMLKANTPVKTGKLKSGWTDYKVERVKNGFEITLTNTVEYAKWVNDGHYSYNQFGGAYFVRNRTPKIAPEYETNDDDTFVFGHFFVEVTLWQLSNSTQLEQIIYKQLQKWWEGCF